MALHIFHRLPPLCFDGLLDCAYLQDILYIYPYHILDTPCRRADDIRQNRAGRQQNL